MSFRRLAWCEHELDSAVVSACRRKVLVVDRNRCATVVGDNVASDGRSSAVARYGDAMFVGSGRAFLRLLNHVLDFRMPGWPSIARPRWMGRYEGIRRSPQLVFCSCGLDTSLMHQQSVVAATTIAWAGTLQWLGTIRSSVFNTCCRIALIVKLVD